MALNETIAVALFFIAARFFIARGPGGTLGLMIFSSLIWPEFLRIPVGLFQLSVPRLLILVLLVSNLRSYGLIKKNKIDALVFIGWLWIIIATILANAEFSHISQMIGRFFDTVAVYFSVRVSVRKASDLQSLVPWITATCLCMCCLAVYEAVTWTTPYQLYHNGQLRALGYSEVRYGFLRAQASTLTSIYFGLAMVIVLSVVWSMRDYFASRIIFLLALSASMLATITSLSSGPIMGLATFIFCTFFYDRERYIKPALWCFLAVALLLEILSNRHFYNLIDYFALNSHTAWYRTRLMEVAISNISDFWLIGVGSDWPHHWAAQLDGRKYIDVVNNFIIVALYGGLPALLLFVSSHYIAVVRLTHYYKTLPVKERRLFFGLAASLISIDFTSFSVGLFGPATLFSFAILGLLSSSDEIGTKN